MSELRGPKTGVARVLEPGLRCVLAPNPSPMTYWGTNTYLLGHKDIVVIDPGPNDPAHLQALMAALDDAHVSQIVVTHAHVDHSPLSKVLSEQTGAPVLAFGPPERGRSATMQDLARAGLAGGGEGVDTAFQPDVMVNDGDRIESGAGSLEVIHTPGHMGNHICIGWQDVLFCGDHVMGWASSLVSPPDGDLTDFMISCRKLHTRNWRVFYSGHGNPIIDPKARLAWLIAHRKGREAEILAALSDGPATARDLAVRLYADTPPQLLPAASRNVFAHLVDLTSRSLISPVNIMDFNRCFQLVRDL